jgi:dolichol-phosphate mannosyltransferase
VTKISIIIPTYNERSNIKELIKQIFSFNISDLNIIIVDDNSPDGTGGLVESIEETTRLEIIHRIKKMGLGSAYIDGFKRALVLGADYIFEMDADFSHDPKYLPQFLEEVENYDLVLGSRYIEGGGIKNWNLGRRLISYLGNFYARLILNLSFQDLTGGFKCYKRKVIESINLEKLDSEGYVFQIETTYWAYKNGFKIKEIPIIFTERKLGKSKFNFKIFFEAFIKVLTLRFKK